MPSYRVEGDRRLWAILRRFGSVGGPVIVGADFVVWTGEVMNRNKKGPTHKKGPTRSRFPVAWIKRCRKVIATSGHTLDAETI